MIHLQASGGCPGVQVERNLRRNFQANLSRTRANTPVGRGFAFRANISTARINTKSALVATHLHAAGPGSHAGIPGCNLLDFDIAAAGADGDIAGNARSMDATAARGGGKRAFHRVDREVPGAGGDVRVGSGVFNHNASRAGFCAEWELKSADGLVSGAGVDRKFGLGRCANVVVDRYILLEAAVFHSANADGVALLFDRWNILNALDFF